MKTVSLASIVKGVLTYTIGNLSPDFICADSITMFEVVESVHDWYKQREQEPIVKELHGKRGLVIEDAIVVRDVSVARGYIKLENYSDPTNPHLNGLFKLEYNLCQ